MSIRGLNLTPFTYHGFWPRAAGIPGEGARAWEHRMLCQAIGVGVQYDRLDVTNVAAFELMARRLVMIERAVKVSPKAPSFTGLHRMIEHSLSEGGGVATKEFTSHMAEQAEKEARIMKQNRLLREELGAKDKGDGHGGGGGGRKEKKGPKGDEA